jgi:hypothetical protein
MNARWSWDIVATVMIRTLVSWHKIISRPQDSCGCKPFQFQESVGFFSLDRLLFEMCTQIRPCRE